MGQRVVARRGGLGLLIVAGARPRFGVYTETVKQRGVDLFVLLDVSRSMTAEDVLPTGSNGPSPMSATCCRTWPAIAWGSSCLPASRW